LRVNNFVLVGIETKQDQYAVFTTADARIKLKHLSLSQNPAGQIIKYQIIRKAARQKTAANNTNDTFACPLA
jgi:hypothetical protein